MSCTAGNTVPPVTHGFNDEAERNAVRPRHFLVEVENVDNLVQIRRLQFFSRRFLRHRHEHPRHL